MSPVPINKLPPHKACYARIVVAAASTIEPEDTVKDCEGIKLELVSDRVVDEALSVLQKEGTALWAMSKPARWRVAIEISLYVKRFKDRLDSRVTAVLVQIEKMIDYDRPKTLVETARVLGVDSALDEEQAPASDDDVQAPAE